MAFSLSFHFSFGLPVTVIRPFNAFGPRQSLRAIIPTIIDQYLDEKNKNLKLGLISTKRDFNFVDDIVAGFVKTINNNRINGEVINIGSGKEYSIKDIIKLVEKITKKKLKLILDKKRVRPKKSEVLRLLADNKKALRLLNWRPRYASLNRFEKAIEITVTWTKKNKIEEKNNYQSSKYVI